jgi:hypothetical protein
MKNNNFKMFLQKLKCALGLHCWVQCTDQEARKTGEYKPFDYCWHCSRIK